MLTPSDKWQYFVGDSKFLLDNWTGPKPPPTHPRYSEVMGNLAKVLQSYNILEEVVTHYVNALVGQSPNWYVKDSTGEAVKESEAEKLLQSWLDWQRQLAVARTVEGAMNNPIAQALAQALVTENGYLRLYTPSRYATLADPVQRIALHCPRQGSIKAERDDDGFIYKCEYTYGQGKKEIYTLLDDGKCEIITPTETYQLDLGGRMPIFALSLKGLISSDVISCQNSINKTLTMKSLNVDAGGFLERVILNAQMPGEWIADPASPNGEKFIPDRRGIDLSANSVAFVQGMPIGDPKAPSGYTNPSITYRQPVNVSTFKESIDIDIALVYRRVGLGHLLTQADGSISGVSRETIKQDFQTRLEGYAEAIEAVLGNVYSVVLSLLGISEYEPVVSLRFSAGKPLPEERKENRDDYNTGLRSRTTAMSASGIDDPDAEWELIKREKEEDKQRGEAMANAEIPELQAEPEAEPENLEPQEETISV